jgi:hypothetical protein
MTMEASEEQQGENEELEPAEPSYVVSPQIFEALGRSIPITIGERLCDAALAKLKSEDAWLSMTYKELRKLFKDNCSDQEGYLSPQQPVLETVVRMLLAAKQDSLTLSSIHADVSELWMTSPWPRHISADSLQRVLDNGRRYGIVRADG